MHENPVPAPRGELTLRTVAMPADTNPDGDIFGGWLLGQMDMAGGIAARQYCGRRVATVAVDAMVFHRPVFVGDVVCCYAELIRTGTTSLGWHVQAWVLRRDGGMREIVTEGRFTFVAIGPDRRPVAIAGDGRRT